MKPELYDYVDNKIQETVKAHGPHLRRAVYDIMVHNHTLERVGAYEQYTITPAGYWTLDRCKASALKYKTRTEWQKGEVGAYTSALKNNWIDECCEHMVTTKKPHGYWTLETCKESALNYSIKSEWCKGENGAYDKAYKNKWMDECCEHMEERIKPQGYWTLERCKESALRYTSRKKWGKYEGSAYTSALKNNWIDECCEHMVSSYKPSDYWTLQLCKESALKYKNRSKWAKGESGAHGKAYKNKWMDECCQHMKERIKPNGYWTLEKCKESALKYKTKSEWKSGESGAYQSAYKNNWLKECRQHMEGGS